MHKHIFCTHNHTYSTHGHTPLVDYKHTHAARVRELVTELFVHICTYVHVFVHYLICGGCWRRIVYFVTFATRVRVKTCRDRFVICARCNGMTLGRENFCVTIAFSCLALLHKTHKICAVLCCVRLASNRQQQQLPFGVLVFVADTRRQLAHSVFFSQHVWFFVWCSYQSNVR